MHLEQTLRYPARPEEVAAVLADRSFVEELCAAGEAQAWEVAVTGSAPGGFTVTTSRTLPTAALPDAVRRFLGAHLQVRQVDTWAAPGAGGERRGTTALEIVGVPVTASADLSLAADGAGSLQRVTGELRAAVPLVGARVERAAEPVLVAALREQEQLAGQRLRG